VYSIVSCLTCFQSPVLRVNRRKYKIVRLLGEGGFSYVYLVEDIDDGQNYALKKIRCPFGQESLQVAMSEVESYRIFHSPRVIRALESAVVTDPDGSKVVYIVLPFYQRGNLQDRINRNLMNNQHFEESELTRILVEICRGILVMHKHHLPSVESTVNLEELDNSQVPDENEEQRLLSGVDSGTDISTVDATAMSEVVAFAHRDIKPANVMLSDQGTPILMDLGSCSRARMTLETRRKALELQDLAAEHCTLPYRAPELFDVKTGASVDERVDIWSLGCTLFSLMYSVSPFEMQTNETGASLSLAVANGQYKFPSEPNYSDQLKDIVRKCLTVDPQQRPFIDEILHDAQALLETLDSQSSS
jgi:serine/threonine kinase 16